MTALYVSGKIEHVRHRLNMVRLRSTHERVACQGSPPQAGMKAAMYTAHMR